MMRRSSGQTIRKEDLLVIIDNANLSKDEEDDIKSLLEDLLYNALKKCDIFSIKDKLGKNVELSEKRKTYLELFKERGFDPKKDETDQELQAIRVLGEYKDGIIILYINNIKDCANEQKAPGINREPYLTVTRYVYLHELMHAFFDKGAKGYVYDLKQEEGLAEFGALLHLNQLVNTTPDECIPNVKYASKEELDWAVRHVEGKKGALECYARGAYLFKLFGHDKELSKKMLEAYPKSIE
jgi:hypothetical protein